MLSREFFKILNNLKIYNNRFLYTSIFSLIILNLTIERKFFNFLLGEGELIEILQLFFLILGVITTFKYKHIFLKKTSQFIFRLKIFVFLFLIYEEASFLTTNLFNFASKYNVNSQFNWHNSNFLTSKNLLIPLGFEDIHISTVFVISIVIFISFGSYYNFSSKIKFLIFEKKYKTFGIIFLGNIILSLLLRKFTLFEGRIMNDELLELYLYFTICSDTFSKLKKYKK